MTDKERDTIRDCFYPDMFGEKKFCEIRAIVNLLSLEALYALPVEATIDGKKQWVLALGRERSSFFADFDDETPVLLAPGDLKELADEYLKYGDHAVDRWICKQEQEQPILEIALGMVDGGSWDEEMAKLPENKHEAEQRAVLKDWKRVKGYEG